MGHNDRRQHGRRDDVKNPDDVQDSTPPRPGRRGQHAPALLASAAAASARLEPLPGPSFGSAPAPVQVITMGGMPGWQIALIAVGAALVAAVAAVLLDRARMARRVTAAVS